MAINTSDFAYVADLARKNAAIVIEPGKEYLVESRLTPLAKTEGFDTLEAFLSKLRLDPVPGPRLAKVIDALTTNETLFFRDHHPFEALKKGVLPKIIEARAAAKKITIWCAASSTGQEPYSIAMLVRECFPQLRDWTVNIIATDISPRVLQQARLGQYNKIEVNRGLPAIYLVKYFTKQDDTWTLKEDVRKMVDYRMLNLIQPFNGLPVCDVVFIRNVLIYFDTAMKQSILRNIRKQMAPDGYMFLGTAETTLNIDAGFKPATFGPAVAYQAKEAS
jgi:chemotaxis protein methyltransferase CheR